MTLSCMLKLTAAGFALFVLFGNISLHTENLHYIINIQQLLPRLYRNAASELGFGGFHLHLRPVTFETAEQRPVVTTETLEDDGTVDR